MSRVSNKSIAGQMVGSSSERLPTRESPYLQRRSDLFCGILVAVFHRVRKNPRKLLVGNSSIKIAVHPRFEAITVYINNQIITARF